LKVGDQVQVKGADEKWIPARVQEVETRRTVDPKTLGSPQLYKLYAINSYDTFVIGSKNFKSDLRLEPVHEDENNEAVSEPNPVIAAQVPGVNADVPNRVLGWEIDAAEAATITNGSFIFLFCFFILLNKAPFFILQPLHYSDRLSLNVVEISTI